MTRLKKLNNDERFKHVSYHKTNVAATIARVRREQQEQAKANETAAAKVQPITRGKRA